MVSPVSCDAMYRMRESKSKLELFSRLLRSTTKWNANLILLRDYGELVALCKVMDRFHMTSSSLKSKTKAPPKFLSSSGIRDGTFISVYNFTAQ